MYIRIRCKRSQSEIIDEAVTFFGPAGLGMDILEQVECCAYFMGGRGGHVNIQTYQDNGETRVEIAHQGWERPAQEFVSGLT